MPLDEGDKAIIKEISFEAAEHMAKRIEASVNVAIEATKQQIDAARQERRQDIALHAATCPTRAGFEAAKNKFLGVWVVLTLFSGAFIFILKTIYDHIWGGGSRP